MVDQASQPEFRVQFHKGEGWELLAAGKSHHLSYSQASLLLETLLRTMPIDRAIDLAWDNRHDPKIQVLAYFGWDPESDTITHKKFQAEVYILDNCVWRSSLHPSQREAIAEANNWAGAELMCIGQQDAPGSRKVAFEEQVMTKAAALAAEEGLTLAQWVKKEMANVGA